MKGNRAHSWIPWLPIWLFALLLGGLLGWATEPCYNPQSPTPNPQSVSVAERLFGEGARPHIIAPYSKNDVEWLLEPANLQQLRDLAVGHVVFFGNLYKGQAEGKGHVPIDGHYEYTDPDLVAKAQQAVRLVGCKVIGYMHGVAWKRAGLTPFDALEEIRRHAWDGVYLDNAEVGRNWLETWDFMARLKGSGLIVIHHASVEPHFGYAAYRGPWAVYEDYTRLGETGRVPKTLDDPLWRYRVSQLTRSNSIGIFSAKNVEWARDHPELWMPMQPKLGCIVWLVPYYIPTWKEHYFPAYKAACQEYRADPAAFEINQSRDRKGANRSLSIGD